MELKELQTMIDQMGTEKGEISDGSHSFNELYYHRMMLFSIITKSFKSKCWKSWLHEDGTMFDDYFIVGICTPDGDYTYHYHKDYWDMFDVYELEKAPKWDGHEAKDVDRLLSLFDVPDVDEWASKEVSLACSNEEAYGIACYNSAYKAYLSLREDGHTGFSIGMTKQILNRLMNHQPLTPLTGEDDEWRQCERGGDVKVYQNKRYSALFKDVHPDGMVEYRDIDKFICCNINTGIRFHAGYIGKRVSALHPPIEMPYYPPSEPIVIITDDFLYDEKNGDFDTVAIYRTEEPDGNTRNINVFLAEKNNEFIEISEDEYKDRYDNRVIRGVNNETV